MNLILKTVDGELVLHGIDENGVLKKVRMNTVIVDENGPLLTEDNPGNVVLRGNDGTITGTTENPVFTSQGASSFEEDSIAIPPASSTNSGSAICNIAGTAQLISIPSVPCTSVLITADPRNTGLVSVGGANTNPLTGLGVVLQPGTGTVLNIENLNLLYINSVFNSEGVNYTYLDGGGFSNINLTGNNIFNPNIVPPNCATGTDANANTNGVDGAFVGNSVAAALSSEVGHAYKGYRSLKAVFSSQGVGEGYNFSVPVQEKDRGYMHTLRYMVDVPAGNTMRVYLFDNASNILNYTVVTGNANGYQEALVKAVLPSDKTGFMVQTFVSSAQSMTVYADTCIIRKGYY